jgi:hypothetical protein
LSSSLNNLAGALSVFNCWKISSHCPTNRVSSSCSSCTFLPSDAVRIMIPKFLGLMLSARVCWRLLSS